MAVSLALSGSALWSATAARANGVPEGWPDRPVKIVVPFVAGGPTDIIARSIGERLRERWGQPVVVENRPGASGVIGTTLVAKSKPDGLTLLLAAASHVMNPKLFPTLAFDPVADFTPITRLAGYAMGVLVANNVPVRSIPELVAYLKANPGGITVGNTGNGSAPHLAAVMFEQRAGVQFTHVPYQGAAQMSLAILSGEVQANFQGASAMEQAKAGRLRALAVTSAKRIPEYPDVKTLDELGYPGFQIELWYGVMAPAGLNRALRDKIYEDIRWAMSSERVHSKLATSGIKVEDMGPDEFARSMKQEVEQWAEVIRIGKVQPQ